MKQLFRFAVSAVLVGGLTLVLLEVSLAWMFHNPSFSVLPLDLLRTLYKREFRSVIQTEPACAIYDDKVTYTLKPGSCEFSNFEFDTRVTVNSAGLRSTEADLVAPEAIFLGDSSTMGWGVEDAETFPRRVADRTALRTLNAGISSYGTARAAKLLERLDTSAVRYVVVQYAANDVAENRELFENGRLRISDRNTFDEFTTTYRRDRSYYPGHYSLATLLYLWWSITDPDKFSAGTAVPPTSVDDEVIYFLNALERIAAVVPEARLVLFEMNGLDQNRPEFASRLKAALDDVRLQENVRSAVVLDSSILSRADSYHLLDTHLNATGHAALADLLVEEVFSAEDSVDKK